MSLTTTEQTQTQTQTQTYIGKFNTLIENFTNNNKDNRYSKLIKDQFENYYDYSIVQQEEEDSTQSEKYFINAIKVFDNDNNVSGSNNVCIPLDFVDVFNFTYPLLMPNSEKIKTSHLEIPKEEKMYFFYDMIDVNDEIFIYQTISRDTLMGFNYNNTHLSILIKTNSGYLFSFGLIGGTGKEDIIKKGLFDFTSIKKAKIITPDKFLEYKLNYEVTNQEQTGNFVKLIAKTLVKRSHIDKIKAIFENIGNKIQTNKDFKIDLYLDYFDIHQTNNNENNEIKELLNKKRDIIIQKSSMNVYNNTMKLFEPDNNKRKYYLSQCFSYDYTPDDNCTLSRYSNKTQQSNPTLKQRLNNKKTKKVVNCSSFLQDLFNDILLHL
jgi:hypothetical protein